jgi:hypothetical protein
MSAATLHAWAPRAHDDGPDAACESCDQLRAELARATLLLKTIQRMESKPSKRETMEDDAATLEAVGHAVFVAAVRARIELFLKGRKC